MAKRKRANRISKTRRRTQVRRQQRAATRAAQEAAIADIEAFYRDVFLVESSPERAADVFLGRLEGRPVPADAIDIFGMASSEYRAREVAEVMMRRAPSSLGALTLAASVAFHVDRDAGRAADLLDEALGRAVAPRDRAELAQHLGSTGRVAEGLDVLEPLRAERTDDFLVMSAYAGLLSAAYYRARRAASVEDDSVGDGGDIGARATAGVDTDTDTGGRGEVDPVQKAVAEKFIPGACPCRSGDQWWDCCRLRERAALRRFDDHSRLDELRKAVADHVEGDPELTRAVAENVQKWLVLVEELGAPGWTDEERDMVTAMASEHAWLTCGPDTGTEPEVARQEGVEGAEGDEDADGTDLRTPIASFARHPDTTPEDAAAVRTWDFRREYGLWMVVDRTSGPGLWVVDLVTGNLRYISVPEADRAAALRWSVLLTTVVPVDGVWRAGMAIWHLSPAEGDVVADLADGGLESVGRSLATGRHVDPRPMPVPGLQQPAGVFVTSSQAVAPEEAALASKILAVLVPSGLAAIHASRHSDIQILNFDDDRLCTAEAVVRVADMDAAKRILLTHPDVVGVDGDPDSLVWWGRRMTDDEVDALEADLEQMGEDFDIDDQPKRWIRGRAYVEGAATLRLEANSRERLAAFLRLLQEVGLEHVVIGQKFFGPPLDLSLRRGAPIPHRPMSEEECEDWAAAWPELPMPGLSGHCALHSLDRVENRPVVEAALREIEHDAQARMAAGLPAPDIDGIRELLDMPVGAWLTRPELITIGLVG